MPLHKEIWTRLHFFNGENLALNQTYVYSTLYILLCGCCSICSALLTLDLINPMVKESVSEAMVSVPWCSSAVQRTSSGA